MPNNNYSEILANAVSLRMGENLNEVSFRMRLGRLVLEAHRAGKSTDDLHRDMEKAGCGPDSISSLNSYAEVARQFRFRGNNDLNDKVLRFNPLRGRSEKTPWEKLRFARNWTYADKKSLIERPFDFEKIASSYRHQPKRVEDYIRTPLSREDKERRDLQYVIKTVSGFSVPSVIGEAIDALDSLLEGLRDAYSKEDVA